MNQQVVAGLESAARSFAFTACGVLAGFLTLAATSQVTFNSVTASGISDPAHLWAFTQANWFPWALANVVTPILRGAHAAVVTKGTT